MDETAMETPPRSRECLRYDIPLSDGKRARITLPIDLTEEDARRLAGMIRALAFDPAELPGPQSTVSSGQRNGKD